LKKIHSILSLFPILFAAGAIEAQTLTPSPTSLSFSGQAGGAAVSQALTVNGTGAPAFFVASNAPWLKVNSSSSVGPFTAPATITVTADPSALTAQLYNGSITILPMTGTAISVPVTFSVGNLGVAPSTLSFAYQVNGTLPNPAPLTLTSASSLAYTAVASTTGGGQWLSVPANGTSPGTLPVSLNGAVVGPSMAPGTYNGSVTITPTAGPAVSVSVTLTVSAAPTVTVSASSVNLNYEIGGATGGTNSASAVVTLSNPGLQDLAFGVSNVPNGTWLSATPTSGTIPANGTATVTVSYVTSQNLPQNTYSGTVTIFVPGAANQQIQLPVSLRVSNSPLLSLDKNSLSFTYQVGAAAPAAKNVIATSTHVAADATTGQMALLLTKNDNNTWLTFPTSGQTGTATPIAVSVNPAGLTVGTYNSTILVNGGGAANNPQTIAVTLTVSNDPMIVATFGGCSTANTTCPLNFPVQLGQTATTTQSIKVGTSTGAPATFTVTAAMTPAAACGTSWLANGVVGADGTFPVTVTPGTIAAGTTCNGTITIAGTNPTSGAALPNSPVTIPVRMDVSATPMMVASPIALNFTLGMNTNSTQNFAVTSTSPTSNIDLTVTSTPSATWLLAFPLARNTAAGSNSVSVIANSSGLTPGTYSATITLTATAAGVQNSPLTVPVTLTVTAAQMSVSTNSLSFQQTKGGNAPPSKTFTVSTNSTDISFTTTVAMTDAPSAGWLTAAPASGVATSATPGTVTVNVNGSTLAPGTYNGTVTVTGLLASGSPATVNVTLQVLAGTLSARPTSLTFSQAVGGQAPAAQTLTISSTPTGLPYTIAVSTDNNSGKWLSATPTSGATNSDIQVAVTPGTLPVGQYTGKVTISSTGAAPLDVPVTFAVVPAQSFTVSPTTLNFSYVLGAAATPQAQTVQLTTGVATPFTAAATTASGGNWLTVSPTSAAGSGTLTIGVNVSALPAGSYTGTVAITSPNATTNPAATVSVNLTVLAVPKPVIQSIANSASYASGAVSPGENIVIFGTGIGPATLTSATVTNNAFPTTVANTQVFFDSVAAPIIYTSAGQTSVMVPYGISGRATTNIRVVYSTVQSDAISYNVATAAPGVYTANSAGTGQGAILNQDYSYNGPAGSPNAKPAAKNSVVTLYVTGEGFTNGSDGVIAPTNGSGLFKPSQTVTATVAGLPATVQYYGSAPGIVYGVMQVNVQIPANAPSGSQPVVLSVGTSNTQANVTVAVQ
jgi:uncharacterized protein (TIGR03437 family)